jgi:hypothetical protein
VVHTTLREPSEQLNCEHDRTPGRSLRDLALEIEDLWNQVLRELPKGVIIDTPKMSILRIVHRLLIGWCQFGRAGTFSMRSYATVLPAFWTGATGKAITAAGKGARIVAAYLLTCEQASILGHGERIDR